MTTRKSNTRRNYQKKSAKSIADLDTKKILKELDKPVSVLVGLAAGVPVAMIVEKVAGKKSTVSGLLGIDGKKLTRILKPAVNIALGMSVHQLTKNPKIKLAGIGLAANGGLIAVKDFLGKDILKGFGDTEEVGSPNNQQTVKVIERVVREAPPSTPLNLPLLEIDEPDAEASQIIERALEDNSGYDGVSNEPITETEEVILPSYNEQEIVESNTQNHKEIESSEIYDENNEGNFKGSDEVDLGKSEDQIAGEIESVYEDNDDDYIDDIP
jgi:hypothetical protein